MLLPESWTLTIIFKTVRMFSIGFDQKWLLKEQSLQKLLSLKNNCHNTNEIQS